MEIRKATFDDLPHIIDLWNQSNMPIKRKGRDTVDNLSKQMDSGVMWILLAIEDTQIIGVVLVTHDSRKGWINRLAILPNYQRRGIASRLIQASEDLLLEENIVVYCALIYGNNHASRSLFENEDYSFYENVVYYTKRVSPEA